MDVCSTEINASTGKMPTKDNFKTHLQKLFIDKGFTEETFHGISRQNRSGEL